MPVAKQQGKVIRRWRRKTITVEQYVSRSLFVILITTIFNLLSLHERKLFPDWVVLNLTQAFVDFLSQRMEQNREKRFSRLSFFLRSADGRREKLFFITGRNRPCLQRLMFHRRNLIHNDFWVERAREEIYGQISRWLNEKWKWSPGPEAMNSHYVTTFFAISHHHSPLSFL